MISKLRWSRAEQTFVGVVLLYVGLFFWLGWCKWSSLAVFSADFAQYNRAFWYTLQGKVFYEPTLGSCYLGQHFDWLLFLLVPFYWIIPSPWTLLFFQTAAIGWAGWILFRIARDVVDDEWQATTLSLVFLVYSTVATMHLDGFHGEVLALPFLMLTFQAYQRQRFVRFMVFLILTMGAQENLPLTTMMFGPYALMQQRSWKWRIIPTVTSLFYLAVVLGMVMPALRGGKSYGATFYLAGLGNTPAEALRNCLTNPGLVVERLFRAGRLMYLLILLQSLMFVVPLCSKEIVFVLPNLFLNLLIEDQAFRTIAWHYNSTIGACLCLATVFGVKNLQEWLRRRWGGGGAGAALPFALAVFSISSWMFWFNPADFEKLPYYETQRKVLSLIPPDRSVLTPVTLELALSKRETSVQLAQFNPQSRYHNVWPVEKMYTLDHVILDANERRFAMDVVTKEMVMGFYTNAAYRLILHENNMFVFERLPEDDRLRAPAPSTSSP